MSQQTTINTILQHPLVPVFYHADPGVAQAVCRACYDGGIRVFEFTNRGPNALQTFTMLRQEMVHYPGYLLGAGTILRDSDAVDFIEAGASFIVSPCFIESVFDLCYQHKIPYMPGCMTVREVFDAIQAGCEIIKVFPGEVVGTAFVKAVTAVLPGAKLMITGGVSPTRDSITSWFSAGASAVGLGSQLFKKELLEQENYAVITSGVAECFSFLPRE